MSSRSAPDTPTQRRHLHEFVALGEVPETLAKGCDRLKWVDIASDGSPAIYINHVADAAANVSFQAHNKEGSSLTYVVALRDIPPYTELKCSYMDHVDQFPLSLGINKKRKQQ